MENLQYGPRSWNSISSSAPAIEQGLQFYGMDALWFVGGNSFHRATGHRQPYRQGCRLLLEKVELYIFSLRLCIDPICFRASPED